jgi:hypothetical protein
MTKRKSAEKKKRAFKTDLLKKGRQKEKVQKCSPEEIKHYTIRT